MKAPEIKVKNGYPIWDWPLADLQNPMPVSDEEKEAAEKIVADFLASRKKK